MVVTSKGNIYTGIAKDPKQRVYDHNFTKKGSKILRGQRPVKLVWSKEMKSKSEALRLENSIKRKSRLEKVRIAMDDCCIPYEELEELLWPTT